MEVKLKKSCYNGRIIDYVMEEEFGKALDRYGLNFSFSGVEGWEGLVEILFD